MYETSISVIYSVISSAHPSLCRGDLSGCCLCSPVCSVVEKCWLLLGSTMVLHMLSCRTSVNSWQKLSLSPAGIFVGKCDMFVSHCLHVHSHKHGSDWLGWRWQFEQQTADLLNSWKMMTVQFCVKVAAILENKLDGFTESTVNFY